MPTRAQSFLFPLDRIDGRLWLFNHARKVLMRVVASFAMIRLLAACVAQPSSLAVGGALQGLFTARTDDGLYDEFGQAE